MNVNKKKLFDELNMIGGLTGASLIVNFLIFAGLFSAFMSYDDWKPQVAKCPAVQVVAMYPSYSTDIITRHQNLRNLYLTDD